MSIKMRYELAFYALMAVALFFGNAAHAEDTLHLVSGPAHQLWTGNLLTLRWGTHQIEFEASESQHWTDDDGGFGSGFDLDYEPWTIDVSYNHMYYHIPMMCAVTYTTHLGQYDVIARCRG